ncbi:hypothetical protein EHEL_101750 [Encephalitozoon hellem ATCC 50504]|uniref:M7GpppX diphosphatase n=1 Tax=Encephalitozoon hellem TaxID=27973 RepID=A0A9Q9CA19_ENCHE|nr:uncharacterized protein EHEL_101750 [Encephalitozoon hellem ATCC 50504]AFM99267.1 hypothetical protein EHEL_101750 [Encephalitozoon hellem ATCC 50504]UTX44255.1 scavenger mRNA decapping enzyme [Encephalitozoon hellem]WEL39746.1 m7GpppX diphosphatase [Encephalitozoon hellem]|eukprot:XP_003888248.1 hypothetical protein EHEL_101750 [Encephalitozoon hellem ATCC 50504]
MENILKEFILDQSLFNSEGNLYIGRIQNQKAILVFPKQSFPGDALAHLLSLPMENTQSNDVYHSYRVLSPTHIHFRVVYPATEEHIKKYSSKLVYVRETYEEYLDFVNNHRHISANWMDNIIMQDKRDTNEKILYEDEEIMIIPDYKWNCHDIDSLHLLVIFKDSNLRTVRDIGSYDLLIKAQEEASSILTSMFSLDPSYTFMFFHYRPTYLRLHLHVINIKIAHEGTASSIRSIPLHDVMHNIRIDPDYYKKDMFVLQFE